MGTRSNTFVKDEDGKIICNMYRQYDGYLSGHGADLLSKFGEIKIINGIEMGQTVGTHANGMGCFSAQMVAYFKQKIGGIYLFGHDGKVTQDNDYTYEISPKNDKFFHKHYKILLWVKVWNWEELIYDGWLSEMPTEE